MAAKNRTELAEKMEIIGRVFEIDGMNDLLNKFEQDMPMVKFSAVVIQISALLLKTDKDLADKIIAMSMDETTAAVQKLGDAEYAQALRNAIIKDVMGFFGSSAPTDGAK